MRLWGTKGPFLRPRCIRTIRVQAQLLINQPIMLQACRMESLRERERERDVGNKFTVHKLDGLLNITSYLFA